MTSEPSGGDAVRGSGAIASGTESQVLGDIAYKPYHDQDDEGLF